MRGSNSFASRFRKAGRLVSAVAQETLLEKGVEPEGIFRGRAVVGPGLDGSLQAPGIAPRQFRRGRWWRARQERAGIKQVRFGRRGLIVQHYLGNAEKRTRVGRRLFPGDAVVPAVAAQLPQL